MVKDLYKNRSLIVQGLFILMACIFIIRLLFLQILDQSYKTLAANNAVEEQKVYATRGLVYDRNDKLIVYNDAIYDIYVIPRQLKKMDTTKFCNLLDISKDYYVQKLYEAKKYSTYKPSIFLKQVSLETFLKFQEYLHEFRGFFGRVRTIRHYPYGSAAHTLGDVGEVDSSTIQASNGYYKAGDYIGKSGIEEIYEEYLRGSKGKKFVFVDVHNREQGKFRNGELDVLPEAGQNIQTTLDIDLQAYGEYLMQNKMGSIVALEPSTGEILAMVSSPSFNPNMLCGRRRGKNFKTLSLDSLKPLFNRPIMAQYPPGSTFKSLIALIALQERAIPPNFYYGCNGLYHIPGYVLHCSHGHPSARNVVEGLQHSCNPYFWQTFRNTLDQKRFELFEDSYLNWFNHVTSFGLGSPLGIDLPGEKSGNIPSVDYYNKLYGKKAWKSSTILSLGIGQGEILMTPLQLANLFAIIANRGYHYTPHVVKSIFNDQGIEELMQAEKHVTSVEKEPYNIVVDGLDAVVEKGTGRRSKIKEIKICGKTGTAQNPHGEDHSLFAAFAPKENPKIAIAVVVENSGGGSRYAAPIASLMIEKYLTDSIADYRKWLESSILEINLIAER